MAVYKVIQDIESEDKLLGPLTLKGFIYAAVAGVTAFIDIRLAISGMPGVFKAIFILLTLPVILLFGTLASPLGREQPTEVWLLSHIVFLLKPRKRRWDQSGIKTRVVVTAPKKIERILTKNFSQTEVKSRLQALSDTLDSRGWAVKNVSVNLGVQPVGQDVQASDERLASAATIKAEPVVTDIHASDDILDEQNNQTAQNVDTMMQEAEANRRRDLQYRLEDARYQAAEPAPASTTSGQLTAEENAVLNRLHQQEARLSAHPPIILGGAPVTEPVDTAKLELAQSGNDLSVATIARLANRLPGATS